MTPDRAAIDAVTTDLRNRMPTGGWDLEEIAILAVTTLQGLGWKRPAKGFTIDIGEGPQDMATPEEAAQAVLSAYARGTLAPPRKDQAESERRRP